MIALLRLFGILPPARPITVRVFELKLANGVMRSHYARGYTIGASGELTFIGTYSDPTELVHVYASGSWSQLVEVAG